MEIISNHPLLDLVEANKNGLKSMLMSYIHATVENQMNFLKHSIVSFIQSGQIGSQICDLGALTFGQSLPPVRTSLNQLSASTLNNFNDQLVGTNEQSSLPASQLDINANNTEQQSVIKQEYDDDDSTDCENCIKGICNHNDSVLENYSSNDVASLDDTGTGLDQNEHAEHQLENNRIIASVDDSMQSTQNLPPTLKSDKQNCKVESNIPNQEVDEQYNESVQPVIDLNDLSIQPSTTSEQHRSSSRKRTPKKFFGDDQSNGKVKIETPSSSQNHKRKSSNYNSTTKKVKQEKVDNHKEYHGHEKRHIVTLELNCTEPKCKRKFPNRKMWKQHLLTQHGQVPYKQLMNNNLPRNPRNQTVYSCTECETVCQSQGSLTQHWKNYHQPGQYQCSVCRVFVANFRGEVYNHQVANHPLG